MSLYGEASCDHKDCKRLRGHIRWIIVADYKLAETFLKGYVQWEEKAGVRSIIDASSSQEVFKFC